MASIYETLLFYSWTVTLVSLIVIHRYAERFTELDHDTNGYSRARLLIL